MRFERTYASAWAENQRHPYERRQHEPGARILRQPVSPSSGLGWLLVGVPLGSIAVGMLFAELFLT